MKPVQKVDILLIEDNAADAMLIRELLDDMYPGMYVFDVFEKLGDGVDKINADEQYDIVITDLTLPDSTDLDCISHIQNANRDIPIIVLSGNDNQQMAVQSVKFGAQDYLVKGQDNAEVISRSILYAIERKKLQLELQYLAQNDTLTGLSKRSFFFGYLEQALKQSRRNSKSLALIFIDVDHFKSVNDNYGHLVGDELLTEIANRLKSSCRDSDLICRYAGDEFTVVLENIEDISNVSKVADKILEACKAPVEVTGQDEASTPVTLNITLSMGIAIYPSDTEVQHELVNFADIAMFASKKKGRNQYMFYSQTDGKDS